ncbi:DUF2334 domain-containing protein [Candidatus Woesearchaeota archaeon]|nr:DUF2334 domain-containing protein [Candidatus Woesearchaeota archaeon]
MNNIDYVPDWRMKKISRKISVKPFAFFRDDDVGYDNDKFKVLAKLFIDRNIPLNVAVIPSEIRFMDFDSAKLLYDDNIFTMQHGFNHGTNYVAHNGDYSEFHSSISIADNTKRLQKGKLLFSNFFDNNVLSFVPPRHEFPQIELLIEQNYDLISGYGSEIELISEKIMSIPVNIDIIENYTTKKIYDSATLIPHIEKKLKRDGFLGILLHHNYMLGDYSKNLEDIFHFLNKNDIEIRRLDK